MCGNISSCFAPLDDRGDRTNQLHWLKLLHASYISLLNQAGKGRVFYSVDKCFETGADLRNIFHKQILKVWTPWLSAFYCVILRATLAENLKACAIARFSKSARARTEKLYGKFHTDTITQTVFGKEFVKLVWENENYFEPPQGSRCLGDVMTHFIPIQTPVSLNATNALGIATCRIH